ncbi:MAG: AMP-binding protein [Candidatus Aegiribacteria sp.]|nr:AMP-binding protein [Candidatus Aegiribacteria sp.]
MNYSAIQYAVYRRLPLGLQNSLVTHAGSKRWKHENTEGFQKKVSSLLSIQSFSSQQIEEYQKDKLISVLLAAKSTEFYSGILPGNSQIIESPFSVLQSVPVLCKDDVRLNYKRLINLSFTGKLIQHGTSGTTGTPLQIFWTQECIDMERALIWRQRKQTGLEFGREWRGMLGGHQIVPLEQKHPPYWRVNKLAKQIYFSTYHLTPETAPAYLKAMNSYNIKAIEGYPSVLYAMAYSFKKSGLDFPLNGIYYGAEPLQDFQRELISEVFHCYIWDYYGLTERVASASEFECRNGLHESWENCILEIVDNSGNVVPDGEYGELVGTSLSNLGFPLLRYRTGDMTRFLPGDCTCDRSSRRIARIDTKREDLLLMPDGSLLSASNLTFPFKKVDNILESQLFQDSTDILQVRIIPSSDYVDSDGAKLVAGLKNMVPESVKIEMVMVREIPRTKSGKFRFCISELTGSKER